MGNQLTTDKLKQVNLKESLPYEVPVEVKEVRAKGESNSDDPDVQRDDDSQIICKKKTSVMRKLFS
jgi:topoisomerase-4 subunit A